MNITSIILSACLALTAQCVHAQTPLVATTSTGGTTFGIRAGVNVQNINGKNSTGDKLQNKLIIGFNIGANAEIPVAPDYYLQPGVLFSTKGARPHNSDATFRISYIEVPVNFVYKPLLGTHRILAGFGPYLGYAVGGKYKRSDGTEVKVTFKNTVPATDPPGDIYAHRLDAGANVLAGYELTGKISLQLNAQLGLFNFYSRYSPNAITTDKTAWKNTGFGISAGYRF